MASFDTLEKSVQDSTPIEVYTVTVNGTTYRWTTAEADTVVGINTYTATAVSRGNIVVDPNDRKAVLVVTLPASNTFPGLYVLQSPASKASITITRLQLNESPTFNTQTVIYRGTVTGVRFTDDGTTAELQCQTAEAARDRQAPRYTFGSMCGHVLYGPGCLVDPTTFTVSGTVSSQVGNLLTVPGLNAKPDGYFNGGFVRLQSTTEPRLILKHVGNVLTLLLPFGTDPSGTAVDALAGCNHLMSGDCATKFDNVLRFGGWNYVPQLNPFSSNAWSATS